MFLESFQRPSCSTQGGKEPEREDLRHPDGGDLPGHLQVGAGTAVPSAFYIAKKKEANTPEPPHHPPSPPTCCCWLLRCCRSEEEMLKFMGLMNSSWVLDGHDIATAFNLSAFHSVVDLGGQRSNLLLLTGEDRTRCPVQGIHVLIPFVFGNHSTFLPLVR